MKGSLAIGRACHNMDSDDVPLTVLSMPYYMLVSFVVHRLVVHKRDGRAFVAWRVQTMDFSLLCGNYKGTGMYNTKPARGCERTSFKSKVCRTRSVSNMHVYIDYDVVSVTSAGSTPFNAHSLSDSCWRT